MISGEWLIFLLSVVNYEWMNYSVMHRKTMDY